VPALPSSILEPLWVQVAALLPDQQRPLAHHAGPDAMPPADQGLCRPPYHQGKTNAEIMRCLKRYVARRRSRYGRADPYALSIGDVPAWPGVLPWWSRAGIC
jgi:hypothetical protein